MTPSMIRALSAAEMAVNHRGLERTVAGFMSTHPRASVSEYYATTTIYALVARGHLRLWGRGKSAVAHITEGGTAALARWREQQAERTR